MTNHVNAGDWSKSVAPILISCVIGQIFGYVTVALRTAYGNIIDSNTESEVKES
jgi:hypothetical protein